MIDFFNRFFGHIEDFYARYKEECKSVAQAIVAFVLTAVGLFITFDKLGWMHSLIGLTWYVVLISTLAVMLFLANLFMVWAYRLARRAEGS